MIISSLVTVEKIPSDIESRHFTKVSGTSHGPKKYPEIHLGRPSVSFFDPIRPVILGRETLHRKKCHLNFGSTAVSGSLDRW